MKCNSTYLILTVALVLLNFSVLISQNRQKIDSLNAVISRSEEDSNQVKNYALLARYYDIFQSKENLNYNLIALNLAKKINFTNGIKKQYGIIVNVLFYKGAYDLAISYYHKYENFLKENGFYEDLQISYNVYGNLLCQQKKYKEASKYYHLARAYHVSKNNYAGAANIFTNLCLLNMDLGALDSALVYGNLAAEIYKKSNASSALANSILGLAEIQIKMGHLDLAELKVNESLDRYSAIGERHGMCNCYFVQGDIFYRKGDLNNSLLKFNQSLELSKELDILEITRDCYLKISIINQAQSNYKLAYENYVNYKLYCDSLDSKNLQSKMMEVEVKYDLTIKNNELERQAEQIGVQQKQRLFLIWGIVLVSIMFAISVYAFIEKKKSSQIIALQKKLVEEKQKEILDSIHYAKRIQNTLLAHKEFVDENLIHNFILFQPKDIVSGDFYWATKKANKFYLAVCDSTGHGVPGAFMSLLNIGFLSEAINEKGIEQPNEVFNFVRQRLIDNISKEGQKDGFDGILICMDQKLKQISYSAANNKPILIQDGNIVELEADRMPVGMGERKQDFKLYTIDSKTGDSLYVYTDGYADQFGGPKGKKFKYKALNELILTLSTQPLEEQHKVLKSSFESWKADLEQVDDVCIIGIRL